MGYLYKKESAVESVSLGLYNIQLHWYTTTQSSLGMLILQLRVIPDWQHFESQHSNSLFVALTETERWGKVDADDIVWRKKNEEILISIGVGKNVLLFPQSFVFFCCVWWPGGTLQGNPTGIDISLFSIEIKAFKYFLWNVILLCAYRIVSGTRLQLPIKIVFPVLE